jgi:hypothetical protein
VEDLTGILAIIMLFGVMPAVFVLPGPIKQWLAQRERREARQLYERLTMEKLDVIKTAVAVGMDKHDLADLDDKLERLIGSTQMKSLLLKEPKLPAGAAELHALEAGVTDPPAKDNRRRELN